MTWKIPLYKIYSDDEDIQSVSKVLKRGTDWALGKENIIFEKLLADYVGMKHCLLFNSGTSALHASLLAGNITKNDKIIVPSFTFIATVNSVKMVDAIPVFADIENERFGLDPLDVERKITKTTKAIIPVHYAGLSCKINEIKKTAEKNNLLLIEDAAESLGSSFKNKLTGSFGDMSILSFAPNKIITTGEGGAVLTNSKKLFERLKLIRSHGRIEKQNYFSSNTKPEYVELGYNWRMSSISAALGISQFNKLEKIISLRKSNANYLSKNLRKFDQIKLPNTPIDSNHVYQLYSILLSKKTLRDKLFQFLTKKGIMSKVYFSPVHKTKYYKKLNFSNNSLSTTEEISTKILSLPIYPNLSKEELNYMINSISEFMEKNS